MTLLRQLRLDLNGREWPRLEVLGSFLSLLPLLSTRLAGIPSFDTIQCLLIAVPW